MSKLPKPLRRKEYYLDKLAKQAMGEEVTEKMPKPLTRTETYLNALAGNAKMLPQVTSEDDGNVLAVVDGEWAKAQPSGGESPISVYDICFDDFTYDSDLQQYVGKAYWGRVKDATKEIKNNNTSFCTQMEADFIAGKTVLLAIWIGDLVATTIVNRIVIGTRLVVNNITGTITDSQEFYFPDGMGASVTYNYWKNDITSTKDGKFNVTQKR